MIIPASDNAFNHLKFFLETVQVWVKIRKSYFLALAKAVLHYLVGRVEGRVCDIGNRKLFVESFFRRNNGRVSHQREMDSGIRNQISLELSQINIQSSIEPWEREICNFTTEIKLNVY